MKKSSQGIVQQSNASFIQNKQFPSFYSKIQNNPSS